MLESIEGDLGVVTIAGPYRTGKSSLVGRALLSNPNAFQTGSTINACTKVSILNQLLTRLSCEGPLDLRKANHGLQACRRLHDNSCHHRF